MSDKIKINITESSEVKKNQIEYCYTFLKRKTESQYMQKDSDKKCYIFLASKYLK